ncbi:MAG: homoserine kinase [bacterium]|nr:homoserine kinase [bacterium]
MLRKHDFAEILSRYRLGGYVNAEPFATGAVQVNVRLTTTKGLYALKWYRNRSRERVQFEVHILRFLERRSFPAPIPVRDASGAYVGEHKGKPYAIYTIVPGAHVEKPRRAHLEQLAACAANLHRVSRGYRPPALASARMDTRQFLWKAAQAEARKLGMNANAKAKLRWMRDQLDALRLPNSLPKGICHYDYHHSNFLFTKGRLSGLVDFDDARHARLVLDVANLLDYWTWAHGKGVDFSRARQLLREYTKHRPLNEAEKRHLFDAWKAQILLDKVYFFGRGQADDFYEKRKIEQLDGVGRTGFERSVFG